MVISRVARRYADAIFESLENEEAAQAFFSDLEDLRASLKNSKELRNFFASPVIDREKKSEIIRVIADGRFGDMMTRALVLLAQKGREGYIHEIILALLELRNQQKGIQPLDVSTAVELSGDLKQRLSDGMQDFTKKNVDVNYSVDPALLGGVVIRIKDTVYDGSIARQLSRLRDSFAKGTAANG